MQPDIYKRKHGPIAVSSAQGGPVQHRERNVESSDHRRERHLESWSRYSLHRWGPTVADQRDLEW